MSEFFDPTSPRQYLERRYGELKSARSTWVPEWQELQAFIAPDRGRWLTTEENKGYRRNRKIYDTTPIYAARTLASGLAAGVTSPARPWFKLKTPDADMMDYGAVREWLEKVEQRMYSIFAQSNVYNCLSSSYKELGVFGTAPMFLYEDHKDVVRGYSMTIGEYFLGADDRGDVTTLIREMQWTVEKVVRRFGKDKVSTAVRNLWDKGMLNSPVKIRHCIEPNDLYRPGMLGIKGKAWRSIWWEEGTNNDTVLAAEGFNSKPFFAPRWEVLGYDTYGRGCGSDTIGDCIGLQAMTKKKARAVDKMIDPAVNLPGSMKNDAPGYSLDPGTNNFIDGMGQSVYAAPAQTIQPNLVHFVSDIQEIQQRINHGFYTDLFLMLTQMDKSGITATEIIEKKAEKLLALGPVVERLNNEKLEPLIDRTFSIMMSAKDIDGNPALVPPPPPELHGVKLGVEFISIFRQAQEQEDVTRTMGYVQNLSLVAQATQKPEALDNVDVDAVAKILADKGGAPSTVVPDQEQVQAKRQARAQMQQQEQQQQQAMQAVEAAKSLGDTKLNDNKNALSTLIGQ